MIAQRTRTVAAAVALAAVMLGTSGCRTARGGGWLPSAVSGKAHFGFSLSVDPDTGAVKGQLQYTDQSAGVNIHGNAVSTPAVDPNAAFAEFDGTYVARPGGATGTFSVEVEDRGEPGASVGDQFTIVLFDTLGNAIYSNGGAVEGGNVQFFK